MGHLAPAMSSSADLYCPSPRMHIWGPQTTSLAFLGSPPL